MSERRRGSNALAECRANLDGERTVIVHHSSTDHWQDGELLRAGEAAVVFEPQAGSEEERVADGTVGLRRNAGAVLPAHDGPGSRVRCWTAWIRRDVLLEQRRLAKRRVF